MMLLAFHLNAGNIVLEIRNKMTNQAVPNSIVRYNETVFTSDSAGFVDILITKTPIELLITSLGYFDLKKTLLHVTKDHYILYLIPNTADLKETIVTGSAKPVLATQSVYSVHTINSQQIYQRGGITLNDVLNYENNNYISNDNILGSSVSMGGISGQNVKILVNGVALTGRENGNIDLGQINLQNIKRIEMIQGPMSVIYGSNAFGGVINLITKTPQKPLTLSLRNYTETIGKCNFSGSLGIHRKAHRLQVTAARNFFSGWSPEDSVDRFMQWKPKTQYNADLNYTWDLNKKWSLNYYSSFLSEKITNKGIPIINPYEGYAFDEYYRTKRLLQSSTLVYNHNEYAGFSVVNSYTDYVRKRNRYKKDLVSLEQIPTTGAGDQDSNYFRTFQSRGTYHHSKFLGMQIILGYEWTHETAISSRLSDSKKPLSDMALFTSLLYEKKKWNVQPSIRVAHNNMFGYSATPAFHLKYDVSKNLQIRASFATGYRSPTLKELYLQFIDQNHTIIGNSDLLPEKGYRAEGSIQYQQQFSKIQMTFSGMMATNNIHDMIVLAVYKGSSVLRVYSNLSQYQNVLFNASSQLKWGHITIKQGLGYTQVMPNALVPKYGIWEYSNILSFQLTPLKTILNINYKFNSKQPVINTDNQFQFTAPIHIGNISLQKTFLNQSLQVQIGMKNIFNIQNSRLSGVTDFQGNAHMSANGMYLFPERSAFVDLNYFF